MFKAKIGDAPADSVELNLFHGHEAEITTAEIEARLNYLRTQGKRSVKAKYRAIALAFLEEELQKRTQDPEQVSLSKLCSRQT